MRTDMSDVSDSKKADSGQGLSESRSTSSDMDNDLENINSGGDTLSRESSPSNS